jgi:DNA-directed RNA polymerase specialized sigma24 family protein
MAKRKRTAARANSASDTTVTSEEKIARLFGLLAVRDIESSSEKVCLLRLAGFRTSEVATLLNVTENVVRVAEHRSRKAKPRLKLR